MIYHYVQYYCIINISLMYHFGPHHRRLKNLNLNLRSKRPVSKHYSCGGKDCLAKESSREILVLRAKVFVPRMLFGLSSFMFPLACSLYNIYAVPSTLLPPHCSIHTVPSTLFHPHCSIAPLRYRYRIKAPPPVVGEATRNRKNRTGGHELATR